MPICQIRSRRGPSSRLEKLMTRTEPPDTLLVFGIQHEFEEECRGLSRLLRRLLRPHRLTQSTFLGTEELFDTLVDIFIRLGNGHWPMDEWRRLEEKASMEEAEILYHQKEYTLDYGPSYVAQEDEDEPPGVLLMKSILASSGGSRRMA